jgi:hypothetical protein
MPFMPRVHAQLLRGLKNLSESTVSVTLAFASLGLLRLAALNLLQVCSAAIMAVSSLCQGLETKITPLVQSYVDELMNALRSSELLRTVKPFAISAFGDIATAVGPAFQPFLEGVLLILNQAADTKVTEVRLISE